MSVQSYFCLSLYLIQTESNHDLSVQDYFLWSYYLLKPPKQILNRLIQWLFGEETCQLRHPGIFGPYHFSSIYSPVYILTVKFPIMIQRPVICLSFMTSEQSLLLFKTNPGYLEHSPSSFLLCFFSLEMFKKLFIFSFRTDSLLWKISNCTLVN